MERRKTKGTAPKTLFDAIRLLLSHDDVRASAALLGIYRKGWAANQQGYYRSFNPHAAGSENWTEWNRGWIQCSQLMRRRKSDSTPGAPGQHH